MSTILLVHGAWHGAWCWDRLTPLLTDAGHHVLALDLPGHGADRTPAWRVGLGAYARAVCEAASLVGEPVIAVGHSMGGMVVSQAASLAPESFAGIVYLCAFVPEPGDTLFGLARRDERALVQEAARWRLGTIALDPRRAGECFYGDCKPEDAERAILRLQPNPMIPMFQRFRPRHPIDGIDRSYVECVGDRAISIGVQRSMRARAGIERVATIDCHHSPFLSDPESLAIELDRIVA